MSQKNITLAVIALVVLGVLVYFGTRGLKPRSGAEANIIVESPKAGETIGLPLVVVGQSRTFENQVSMRLRDQNGKELMLAYTIAAASDKGEFSDFSFRVNYPKPKGEKGTVEVFEVSAKDGAEINKVTIPVLFDKNAPDMTIKVFFGNEKTDPEGLHCDTTYPVERRIAKTGIPAGVALNELLGGPLVSEYQAGARTAINVGAMVNSLSINDDTTRADFNDLLGAGVAGACRVAAIRSQIENTLKQFPGVKNVTISINGKSEGILQP